LKDELDDEESARNYLEILADVRTATIKNVEIKGWTAAPPQPFTTSSLQQAASSHYKMSPKTTMSTAQKLYEGGHITYMRTDSTALSEDALKEIRHCIESTYGEEYVGGGTKKKKVAGVQEAHEAIRPTHIEVAELEGEWTAAHRKLYGLIRTRTLQSQMAAARGEECIVEWLPDDKAIEDFVWAATVRRTTFDGWRRLGRTENIVESDEDSTENQWSVMAALKVGASLTWTHIVAEPHESKPAGRYTEATLVRELEKRGIGRPSTFASIIASLADKKYVEEKDIVGREVSITTLSLDDKGITETKKKKIVGAEKKKLVPTELGRRALDYLLKEFGDLFDYGFTAAMEARLDNIAQGREEWKGVLRDTWTAYKDRYEGAARGSAPSKTGMDLGEGLKAIVTKKGPMIIMEDPSGDKKKTRFFGWPANIKLEDITLAAAKKHIANGSSDSICEYEGVPVYKKKGPYGWYIQCGDRRVKCDEEDDAAAAKKRLEGSTESDKKVLRKIGDFEIRQGPYGKYMFKPALKTKVFVKVGESSGWETWTVADAKTHYDAGKDGAKKRK
jgi:DNA topoisomerase-1